MKTPHLPKCIFIECPYSSYSKIFVNYLPLQSCFFMFFTNIYSFHLFSRILIKLLLKTKHMRLELSSLKCTRKQNLEINICKNSVSQFVSHIGFLGAITNTCPTQGVESVHLHTWFQKVYTGCTPGAWCRQIKRAHWISFKINILQILRSL